jgi:hypothetical protein
MSVTIERLANPEPGLDVKHTIQSPDTQKTFFDKRTESIDFTPTKVSFGPLRLLPTQFLLLEGDEHVSTFFASDEHRRLRIAVVCAGDGRRRAGFDPDSLRAGPGLRVARRERTKR